MGRDGSIAFLLRATNIFCKKCIKMENKEQDFINRYKDVQEAKEEGIRQGIWLCIQKLVELERFDMAKYFMISFGFNKNECEGLLDKNGLNDKMDVFINRLFNENNHIRYLKDIGYHKIGSIFKYNTGMEKIELEVIEIDDSSCDGCVFNNRGYYCMYSCCCNIDREDNTNVIYKEVKRS